MMPRRILVAIFCLFVLGMVAAQPLGVQAGPATIRGGPLSRLFALAQQYHVAAGCAPWRHDPRIDRAAQLHAEDIARHQRVSHVGSDGARVPVRLRRQGYPANRATEGIALYSTPEQSVHFWMSAPPSGPHRRNIT